MDAGAEPDPRRAPVYTRAGDDGTTGLLFGGRVRKDHPAPVAYGDVDEAQAVIGVARATLGADPGPDAEAATALDAVLTSVARDLWVLMAELATAPENRHKLTAEATLVTGSMVATLEGRIDEVVDASPPPTEFVVPGQDPVAAHLDVARTVVRRAERHALTVTAADSHVGPYLNRLSDLLWVLARAREGASLRVRDV